MIPKIPPGPARIYKYRFDGADAFTLLELLTTIAIISTLAVLTVSGVKKLTDGAKKAATISAMRNIHTAIISYSTENDGTLPGPLTVQVYNWARDTPIDTDTPHLGAYIGRYLNASSSPRFADLYCKALSCPALSSAAQRDPAIGQYRTWDTYAEASHSVGDPDNVFGTFGGSTMAQARLVSPRPKKLQTLTAYARSLPILSTIDQEIVSGVTNQMIPKVGIFDGKRLWLSLNGNIILQKENPRDSN